jgi:hypothetical protein
MFYSCIQYILLKSPIWYGAVFVALTTFQYPNKFDLKQKVNVFGWVLGNHLIFSLLFDGNSCWI